MILGTTVALVVLALAGVLSIVRIVRPDSTIVDRAIGLDLLLVTVVAGTGVLGARTGDGMYFDILVVAGLLGFLSTVATARYLEQHRHDR